MREQLVKDPIEEKVYQSTASLEDIDTFYKKLISRIEIAKVSSAFAMEQIKYTTALPLGFVRDRIEELRNAKV